MPIIVRVAGQIDRSVHLPDLYNAGSIPVAAVAINAMGSLPLRNGLARRSSTTVA